MDAAEEEKRRQNDCDDVSILALIMRAYESRDFDILKHLRPGAGGFSPTFLDLEREFPDNVVVN